MDMRDCLYRHSHSDYCRDCEVCEVSASPWALEDKIREHTRSFAKSSEVQSLRSDVDRLEHSLRETRSILNGLLDTVSTALDAISDLQQERKSP
jgi:septal ring factor EnvC (AmiA/AmiB activator)